MREAIVTLVAGVDKERLPGSVKTTTLDEYDKLFRPYLPEFIDRWVTDAQTLV